MNLHFIYGTSGFRLHNLQMDYISLRIGLFINIINKRFIPKCWGLMITASHNPE